MPRVLRAASKPSRTIIAPKRTSARERGYTQRWETYSAKYRRSNPFCKRCLEDGRPTLIVIGRKGVVDHKWPVTDGGPMWDPKNHWGLCSSCHNSWKARLEEHARSTGQMSMLIQWCDDPASRPQLRGDTWQRER